LYLQHFGKIGTGDIVQLSLEIEKEAKEREKAQKEDQAAISGEGGASPLVTTGPVKGDEDVKMGGEDSKNDDGTGDETVGLTRSEESKIIDGEGDVKMESDIK
jgi:THO complex subunit 1